MPFTIVIPAVLINAAVKKLLQLINHLHVLPKLFIFSFTFAMRHNASLYNACIDFFKGFLKLN